MEKSVSGLKKQGSWGEIVSHGQRISDAFESLDIHISHPDAFEEFDDWRPKEGESLRDEVIDRTVEQAETRKGPGEQDGTQATEDFKEASKNVRKAPADAVSPDEAASNSLFSTLIHTLRGFDTLLRQTFRGLERPVYRNVMMKTCPQYFDNELVSANLAKKGLFDDSEEPTYVLEIKINDDGLREKMRENLQDDFD